jgi:hypothetical protein
MMGMAFVAVSIGLGVVFAPVVLPDGALPPRQMQGRICDRVVSDRLTARDLVEVQRGGILVRELDCSVMPHMPWNLRRLQQSAGSAPVRRKPAAYCNYGTFPSPSISWKGALLKRRSRESGASITDAASPARMRLCETREEAGLRVTPSRTSAE